jgi:hypothetical protein
MEKKANKINKAIMYIVLIFLLLSVFSLFNLDFIPNNTRITGNVVSKLANNTNSSDLDENTNSNKNTQKLGLNNKEIKIDLSKETDLFLLKVFELKQASEKENTIKIADSFTEINNKIESISNPAISSSWLKVTNCVYDSNCEDELYFDLIDTISVYYENNNVVHKIIETSKLWNGKHTSIFSNKLSELNKIMSLYQNEKIKQSWEELIKCNGKCNDFNKNVFNLIYLIIKN